MLLNKQLYVLSALENNIRNVWIGRFNISKIQKNKKIYLTYQSIYFEKYLTKKDNVRLFYS